MEFCQARFECLPYDGQKEQLMSRRMVLSYYAVVFTGRMSLNQAQNETHGTGPNHT